MFGRARRQKIKEKAIFLIFFSKKVSVLFCVNEIVTIFASVKNKTSKQNRGSRSWKFK